jgi:RNA polymerase sigma-70 factor (ECF subfamily)
LYALHLSSARPAAAAALSDCELVDAIRAGDQTAFTALYERYFERVYHFAYARLRQHADAEEVAQETFVAVFRSIDAFVGRSALLSWIYGIAKNTVNNHLRRTRAQELRIERAESELVRNAHSFDACSPEEHVNYQRCADAVLRSLESVSEWQAEVFALRHFENLPIQEIADRMARSNDAIRSSLFRVKRLIVEAVGSEFACPD